MKYIVAISALSLIVALAPYQWLTVPRTRRSVASASCFLPTPCTAPAATATGTPALSDTLVATPPTYGVPFQDPDTGEYMEFCTDATHPLGTGSTNSGWVMPSYSGELAASYDNTFVAAANSPDTGARAYFLGLSADALATGGNACGSSYGPSVFTPYVSANWSKPHSYYGVEASGTDAPFAIYECDDPTTACASGNVTLVVDFKSIMTGTFGLTAPTTTTNGEVTASVDGTKIGYWGNGAQDSAIDAFFYDTTSGCAIVADLSTGNEYGTSQCGLALNGGGGTYSICTGCITSGFRTAGANKGIHRAVIDADGDAMIVTNQNNTTGYQTYVLPSGGTWAATPMVQGTTASPSLFANHFCFAPGDNVMNGAGNNAFGSNQNWAFRIRSVLSPDTTYSDLVDTINPGGPITGWAGHISCADVPSGLTMPFFSATYIYATAAGSLTEPFEREVDSIFPSNSAQKVYRFGDPHWQYAAGGVSTANGVVGNGTTVTVTSISNHTLKNGSATVKIYGCTNSAANASPVTITSTSNTTFTYPSAFNGTTTCRFVDTGASNTNFRGASLIQGLRNGHAWVSNSSYGGTFPPDAHDNGNCAGSGMNCPAQEIIIGSTH